MQLESSFSCSQTPTQWTLSKVNNVEGVHSIKLKTPMQNAGFNFVQTIKICTVWIKNTTYIYIYCDVYTHC
jgi:hypothetical protein